MAYEFKDHTTLEGEEVVLTTAFTTIDCEILAQSEGGCYVRVSKDASQEYFVPNAAVLLIEARSRKIRDGGA